MPRTRRRPDPRASQRPRRDRETIAPQSGEGGSSKFAWNPRLAGQRVVDEGERLVALSDRDGRQSKLAAELIGGNEHRPRRRRCARHRLWECRRQRGVEGNVAFALLSELMGVAIENGDRTEALEHVERALTIFGAPAPFLVENVERDMGEDDNRRAVRLAFQIRLEPGG